MAIPSSQHGTLSYRVISDASIFDAPVCEENPGQYHGHPSSLAFTSMDALADVSGAWPTSHAAHPSHSPSDVESPTLTLADLSFIGRSVPPEDQKVPLSILDAAPYAFPNSRSTSPKTPSSASSTSLTPFQFISSDNSGHGHSDHIYRRHSHPHMAEFKLHGDTSDISLVDPASDAVRYRLTSRKETSHPPLLTALPPKSGGENGPYQDQVNSDDNVTLYAQSRSRPRRSVTHSRSFSPSHPPPIPSGTLAVTQAQAFGALRRTHGSKSLKVAAKMDMLETRGV